MKDLILQEPFPGNVGSSHFSGIAWIRPDPRFSRGYVQCTKHLPCVGDHGPRAGLGGIKTGEVDVGERNVRILEYRAESRDNVCQPGSDRDHEVRLFDDLGGCGRSGRADAALGDPIASRSDGDAVDQTATIRKLADAPIQSVELVIMKSDPVQITALIVVGLPNGCHEAAGVATHIAGGILGVNVQNSVPALDGIARTDNFRTYVESVRLGSSTTDALSPFKNDVIDTLIVNDHVIKFTTNGVQDDAATLSGYDALRLAFAQQDVASQVSEEITGRRVRYRGRDH